MGVSHDHTEKCLMSCDVFGRAINTHTDVMTVQVEQRGDSAKKVLALFVVYHKFTEVSSLAPV